MRRLELTFAIIKPHIIKNPTVLQIIQNIILTSNFKIIQSKRHTFTQDNAETFYKEHKDKFFYNRLVTFMKSGPSDLYIMARVDAIRRWREIMGPTKVFRAYFEAPNTIRGEYGLSDTRNATHGSDSPESVKKEIELFFPEFDFEKWYTRDEPYFRRNDCVKFNEDFFLHIIDRNEQQQLVNK